MKKKLTKTDLADRELMLRNAERTRQLAEKAMADADRRKAEQQAKD
jgi:hypothetical protein